MFNTYERVFPVKTKIRKNCISNCWMTQDLKYCLKKKFKLLNLLRKNQITRTSFVAYRNLLNDAIRQAKILYYMKKSISVNNDVKKTWRFINSILNKNNNDKILSINNVNGEKLIEHNMVNYFNNYFINVVSSIISNIPQIPINRFLQNIPSINHSFYFFPLSPPELQVTILKLKDKYCGLHDISTKVLKSVHIPLSFILTDIFNSCIESGTYPNKLKIARVIPIYKSGNKNEISNFRPISTLPNLNKVFEKVIYKRLIDFVLSNSLLSEYQFGFRKNSNTSLPIFYLLSNIVEAIKNKKYAVCIFLDIKKAFDSVNHQILLRKLSIMGFRGNVLSLIKDYLVNRIQYVEVDGYTSSNGKVLHGVPQGSVLGPLLFNLFFNDITYIKTDGTSLFADDGVFWVVDSSFDRLLFRLNVLLQELLEWLTANKLFPNTKKTFLMLFTNRTVQNLPNTYLGADLLEWVDSIKYLGVIIDNRLSFNLQINSINKKLSRSNGILYRLKSFLPKSLLLKLYYSFFYPYLVQNIIIWGGVSGNKLKPIQVSMNKALRSILSISYDAMHRPLMNTNLMYKELKLLKFSEIYDYFLLKFIHFCIYEGGFNFFQRYFSSLLPNHNYETRNIHINFPVIKLELEKSMPIYNFVSLFNRIPNELLLPQSKLTLKRKYRKYALERYEV